MKTLVVYYSQTGRTEVLAQQISRVVDGDLFKLVPTETFPSDMFATADMAKDQYTHHQLPVLQTMPNLSSYDRILVGSPVWSGRLATPVAAFFESAAIEDQTVAVFCTSVGQTDGFKADVKRAVQGGQLKPSLITGTNSVNDGQIKDWLA